MFSCLSRPTVCEVTTALMNEVKPRPTNALVQLLRRKSLKNREKPPVHCYVPCTCNSREGPHSFSGCNTSFSFPETLYWQVWPLSLAGARSSPDLKDGNVVVAVILGQQGDLRPLPERLLWVADFKVPGVKLEQSEYFYLDFKGISKYKHINLL